MNDAVKIWRRQRAGFTLVELLVVIIIISILAVIVVPRVLQRTVQAKEANLRANLNTLRSSITQYQADTALIPPNLTGLKTAPGGVSGWNGPYINGPLPTDPFGAAAAAGSLNSNWVYDNKKGDVSSASTKKGSDGTAFNTW